MKKIFKVRYFILLLLVAITSMAVFGAVYFYMEYQKVLKNPEIITKQETEWLVEKVDKLMVVPTGEIPSTATVLEKDKLKDQEFFKNSENGDKILIYSKAKKAILYRPSTNKIIEVMPLVVDETKQEGVVQTLKISLYNGSNTSGLTNSVESSLKEKVQNIEIVKKESAVKSDYKKTIVVDNTGANQVRAKEIADAIGGEVGALPSGEQKDSADIQIILGE